MKKRKMGQSYYGIIRFPVRSYILLQIYYNRSSHRHHCRIRTTAGLGARVGQIKRKLLHCPPLVRRPRARQTCKHMRYYYFRFGFKIYDRGSSCGQTRMAMLCYIKLLVFSFFFSDPRPATLDLLLLAHYARMVCLHE
jgi:hypothetical protein